MHANREGERVMITGACTEGRHGSAEIRSVAKDGWEAMFIGTCAGTVFSLAHRTETACDCECHKQVDGE
jgi:hypothetical protein